MNMVISMIILIFLLFIVGIIIFKCSKRVKSLDNFSQYLLILAGIFIAIAFVAPYSITGKDTALEFLETGDIGDTIGGIMSPFISIAAVIVTGLAFYAQYRANEMVRKQFELQKFENQFYERLRLHKENVNEMEIEIKYGCIIEKNKTIKGRTAFYKILEDLERQIKNNKDFNTRKAFQDKIYLEFYKKYGRYISHYFRHLYHTVKFVVNKEKEIINEKQKKEYLQILRAQMSNDEQKLLFYNWLAPDYGGDWENKTNSFFTEHKMLHNLWHDKLVKNKLINRKLEQLVRKHNRLGREEKLFEIGDDIDKNFLNFGKTTANPLK